MNKIILTLLILCFLARDAHTQEPYFSQVYSLSQFLSPASVGDGLFQNRIQSNIRTQNLLGNSLAKTVFVGWDTYLDNIIEGSYNYIGIGANVISEQIMGGAMQVNHLSLNISSHIFLDEELNKNLSIGLGGTFSQATLQFDKLNFNDQFSEGELIYNSQSISLLYLNKQANNFLTNTFWYLIISLLIKLDAYKSSSGEFKSFNGSYNSGVLFSVRLSILSIAGIVIDLALSSNA